MSKVRPHILIKAKPNQNMQFPYFKREMREVHVGYGVREVKFREKCGSHTQQWLVRGGGEAYMEDKGPMPFTKGEATWEWGRISIMECVSLRGKA